MIALVEGLNQLLFENIAFACFLFLIGVALIILNVHSLRLAYFSASVVYLILAGSVIGEIVFDRLESKDRDAIQTYREITVFSSFLIGIIVGVVGFGFPLAGRLLLGFGFGGCLAELVALFYKNRVVELILMGSVGLMGAMFIFMFLNPLEMLFIAFIGSFCFLISVDMILGYTLYREKTIDDWPLHLGISLAILTLFGIVSFVHYNRFQNITIRQAEETSMQEHRRHLLLPNNRHSISGSVRTQSNRNSMDGFLV